jgi:hypothetical protein
MDRGWVAATACALVLSVAACSVIADFKGLAGSAQPDAAAGDAGADARTADGATSADGAASGEGGTTVSEGGSVPCPPNAAFCDDFDTPPLGAKWDSITLDGKADIALFDGGSLSPPYSLEVALAMQMPGPSRHAELEKNLTNPGHGVKCAVSVRIESAPPSGDATLMTIRPTSGEVTENEVYITYNAQNGLTNEDFKFADGGGDSNNGMFVPFPMSQWFRLTFATDYATMDVLVDGVKVGSMQLGPRFQPTSLQVALGERYDTERGPSFVLFDDYACVVTP